MVVIKFPLRSEHFQETEIDNPAADGSHQFRSGAEFEGNLESESWCDAYGDGQERLQPKNSGRKKALSPAQVIAQSIGPSSPMPTVRKRTPTPAEVIAQSLQPTNFGGAGLLGDSFWQGWMEHEEYLRRKCNYLLGGNREEAEDVLSAAMMQAFQNFTNQSCGVGNMRAWLTTIVHNACMDGFRKSKRKNNYFTDIETSEIENIPADYGAPSQSPEDIVRVRESLDELYQLILALPETLREPLLLRTIEHLSYPEIATRLNLTEANVRKRLQQARDRLRASKLSDGLSEYSGNTPRNY